ncbi:cytochrome P450 [Streptomyces olivoverticillatus]
MTDAETGAGAFPIGRSCPFDPPKEYAALRADRPITRAPLRTGGNTWVLTSHELVRRILTDSRLTAYRPPGALRMQDPDELPPPEKIPLVALDPPEHTVHRRMVANEFTVKRIRGMRPFIQQVVDNCIDAMLANGRCSADLFTALAVPVPSQVICELLGVPYADRERFLRIADVLVDGGSTEQQVATAIDELREFLAELVAGKARAPEQDLLSQLIVKYQEADTYQPDQVISTAQVLLNAGHETTTSMIGLGTLALLDNPDQLAAFKANPSLAPQLVEELMRFLTITDTVCFRTATARIDIGGVTIERGDAILPLSAAANRDPAVYENPDALDIHRSARKHIAFGYGIHQCLGQNLARLELEIVFTTLFARIPDLRLDAPLAGLPYKSDGMIYGVTRVPVAW